MSELLEAVLANDVAQAEALLHARADVSHKFIYEKGFLHHATSAAMTALLLAANAPLTGEELTHAIRDSDLDRVRLLLAEGAFEPRHLPFAALANSIDMVAMCLPHCSDQVDYFSTVPGEPRNALQIAVGHDNLDMVDLLLRHGADPRIRSHAGLTALHQAARHGAGIAVARRLLDAGASVVARTHIGRTPLHLAAEVDTHGLLQFLLQATLDAPRKYPHPVFDPTILRDSILSIAVGSGRSKNVATILQFAPAAIHAKTTHPIEKYVPSIMPRGESRSVIEAMLERAKVGGNAVQEALVERDDMRACFAALGHAPNALMGRYTWADPVREAIMMHLVPESAARRDTIRRLSALASLPLDSPAKRAR